MITRIGHPSPITGAEIAALVKLVAGIWTFFTQKNAGVDPRVEKAISAVEAKAGLTYDVMWAYNWFDHRYVSELGETYWDEDWDNKRYEEALDELRRTGRVSGFDPWNCYQNYAWKHFYWWESEHYKKLIEGTLGRIGYHLEKEIARLAEEAGLEIPIVGIEDWLKKNVLYLIMGGLGLALILVLVMPPRRAPEIVYLPKV